MATSGAEACAQCLGRRARRARCVGVCVVRFVPGRVGARQPRSLSQVQGFALSEESLDRCRDIFELLLGSAIIRLRTLRFMKSVEFFMRLLQWLVVVISMERLLQVSCHNGPGGVARHGCHLPEGTCKDGAATGAVVFLLKSIFTRVFGFGRASSYVSGCIFCACCRN